MKKQTAVEWLVEYLTLHGVKLNNDALNNVINQAKKMEKDQIMDAYNKGHFNGYKDIDKFDEQYYNETYKNTEE